MIYSTILAAVLTSSAHVVPVPDQSKSFVEVCKLSTETLKLIQEEKPRYLELINSAVELKELTGSDEHLKRALQLYGEARENEDVVKATMEIACHPAEKK